MAVNIFDKYGIKEVANVYFEALDSDPAAGVYAGDIVLFLDTLKVSTIETTAENTAAQGGWGNPKLVQWDYGKEINITLEDALMSLESLRFMLGGAIKQAKASEKVLVRYNEEVVCKAGGVVPLPKDHISDKDLHPKASAAHPIRIINLTTGARTQLVTGEIDGSRAIKFVNPSMLGANTEVQTAEGDHLRLFWEEEVDGTNANDAKGAVEVTISPDTFPGTYRVVGDTFMRSEKTGKDEPFQFVINKAKVQSNVTITLQAEGDPSTFEMTLNVLRSTNEKGENEMMKLIRYNVEDEAGAAAGDDIGSIASAGSLTPPADETEDETE